MLGVDRLECEDGKVCSRSDSSSSSVSASCGGSKSKSVWLNWSAVGIEWERIEIINRICYNGRGLIQIDDDQCLSFFCGRNRRAQRRHQRENYSMEHGFNDLMFILHLSNTALKLRPTCISQKLWKLNMTFENANCNTLDITNKWRIGNNCTIS